MATTSTFASASTTTAAEASQIQTAAAKDLVSAVARAFYDDDKIVVIDFLLREHFLPDGPGMGKRLHLSTKQVRKTLHYLQAEHLVACESVEAIVETQDRVRTYRRPQTRKFWYIDLNRAVLTIHLRLHLIREKLNKELEAACNDSHYVCPGYTLKTCNGHYTALEAMSLEMDEETGKFLCRECLDIHRHNPNPPPHSYVLEVVDTQEEQKQIKQVKDRFVSQLKTQHDIDGRRMRPGVFETLHKIRPHILGGRGRRTQQKRRLPVTSNLPSEHGAVEFMEDRLDMMTTTYENDDDVLENGRLTQLLADDFSSLFYCRHPVTGQPTALDLEITTTMTSSTKQAFYKATRTRSDRRKSQVKAAAIRAGLDSIRQETNEPDQELPAPTNNQEPEIPRPAKMTCRQSTPYFLKSEFQNSSHSDGCVGLDDDEGHTDNDDDDLDVFADEEEEDPESSGIFLAKLNQDMEAMTPTVTRTEFLSTFNAELSMALPTGDEDRERSAISYASVPYWED